MAKGKRFEQISHGFAILTLLLFVAGLSPESRRAVVFLPQTLRPAVAVSAPSSIQMLITGLDMPLPEACREPLLGKLPAPVPQVLPICEAEPIAGATVRAYLRNEGSYFPVGSTLSDEEGRARLDELPSGDYWLLIESPGKARRALALSLQDGITTLQLVLEPRARLLTRVVDENGKPIREATVLLNSGDPLPFGALTDGGGIARFDRMGSAPWRVSVSARGYQTEMREDVSSDLQVTLRRLGGLMVRVVGDGAEPIAGATVLIVGASLWPARQTTTNAEGTVRISGLASGVYDLRAQAGDRISESRIGVALELGKEQELTLRLVSGRYIAVLVVAGEQEGAEPVASADVILVENGISPFPWQGRTGDDGRVTLGPIAGGDALVAAHAEGFVGRPAVPVMPNLEGPLRIALRRGGTVIGEVVDRNGHAIDGASLEVVGTDLDGLPIAETPFSVALRQSHFEAALPAPAPLIPAGDLGVMAGPIPGVPGSTATPPARIQARFVLPTIGDPWVSGVEGDFKLYPVTPGRIRVLARHPTFIEAESAILTLEPGGELSVKIVMLEGAELRGRVLDSAGLPVANARIELTSVRGSSKSSTFTASDGSFVFAAVPGEILLSLARPEDPSQFVVRKALHLKNEERREVELILPTKREAVTVTVRGDRAPIETAEVLVISLDPEVPLRQTAFSDAQGQVKLADTVGLPLRLQIEAPGFGKYQKSFEAAPAEIEIELLAGVLAQGLVTAVRGRQNLDGAQVTVVAEGQRQTTHTDARGIYQFSDLNPGQVTLIVSHPEYATAERVVELVSTGRSDRAFDIDAIDLTDAGRARGVVLDAAGNPVAGARVGVGVAPAFLPAGDLPAGVALSNGRGEFELSHLEPGRVSIGAYAVDIGRGTAEAVEIRAGDVTSEIRITLSSQAPDTGSDARAGIAATLAEVTGSSGQRIIVVQVTAGSEAERSNLRVGDVIVRIDGETISTLGDARARLGGSENSDVLVEVRRAEETQKLRIRRELLRH